MKHIHSFVCNLGYEPLGILSSLDNFSGTLLVEVILLLNPTLPQYVKSIKIKRRSFPVREFLVAWNPLNFYFTFRGRRNVIRWDIVPPSGLESPIFMVYHVVSFISWIIDCQPLIGCYCALNVGSIPPTLGGLSRLLTLSLSSNKLSGGMDVHIRKYCSVSSPYGYYNTPNIATSVLHTVGLFRYISTTHAGSIPPEIGSLSQLTVLSLQRNELTGEVVA